MGLCPEQRGSQLMIPPPHPAQGWQDPWPDALPNLKGGGYETVWEKPAPPLPNVISLHPFLLSSLEEWLLSAEVVVLPSKFTTQGGAFGRFF